LTWHVRCCLMLAPTTETYSWTFLP
jgi:hypothetical protein